MKIKVAYLEEKQTYWGTLGDYSNPDRYEEAWMEMDVRITIIPKSTPISLFFF